MDFQSNLCFNHFLQLSVLNEGIDASWKQCVLKSASTCIHTWVQETPSSPDRYSLLYTVVKKLTNSHDTSSVREAISLFFPSLLLLLAPLSNPTLSLELQQWADSLYSRGIEECQCSSLFLQQLLWKDDALTLDPLSTLSRTFDALGSSHALLRKYGLALLNSLLRHVLATPQTFAPLAALDPPALAQWTAETVKHWNTFISVYQTLDEYATHLVRSVWGKVDTLTAYSPAVEAVDFLKLTPAWVELLYRRGLTQGNPHIRSLLFSFVLAPTSPFVRHAAASVPFIIHSVVPLVNDAGLFRGALYGIGFPFLAFLTHVAAALDETERDRFYRELLATTGSSITNPVAFQFIMGLFDPVMIPQPPHDLTDTVNSSASGAESISPQMIAEVTHSSLTWRPTLDGELCTTLEELSSRIVSQVSQPSLQKKAQRTLLGLAVNHGAVTAANLPSVIRLLAVLRAANGETGLSAALLKQMQPACAAIRPLLTQYLGGFVSGEGDALALSMITLLAQLDSQLNPQRNEEVIHRASDIYSHISLSSLSGLRLLTALGAAEGMLDGLSPQPVLALLRDAFAARVWSEDLRCAFRLASALQPALFVEEMTRLFSSVPDSDDLSQSCFLLRWASAVSVCLVSASSSKLSGAVSTDVSGAVSTDVSGAVSSKLSGAVSTDVSGKDITTLNASGKDITTSTISFGGSLSSLLGLLRRCV